MGILSVILVGAWLILFGLAFAAAVTISSGFLGWAAVVTGAVVLIENILWPLVKGRGVVNTPQA